MLDTAIENAHTIGEYQTEEGMMYSIKEIKGEKEDYGIGVYLDTDFFAGVKPRDWGKKIRDFVYNNLAGKELTVYNDGEAETIYLAKKNDRVQKDGANNSHKVIDKLARYRYGDNVRSLSVVHIDELAETSKYQEENSEHTHQWLDENGWEFRTAYAQDRSGKIYEMLLNIGEGNERKILYAINNIKEIDHGDVVSEATSSTKETKVANGLAHKNQSLESIITDNPENASTKFSLKEPIEETKNSINENTELDEISYEKIIAKEDMKISKIAITKEEIRGKTRKQIVEDSIEKLKKKGLKDENNVIKIYNKDTGKEIVVGKTAINHGLDRNYEYTAMVSLHLDSYLENAIKNK